MARGGRYRGEKRESKKSVSGAPHSDGSHAGQPRIFEIFAWGEIPRWEQVQLHIRQ